MSNFFDNFIGGLAFGMMAGNPFFGGMRCCCGFGGGFGGGSSVFNNMVDFGTFANGFPQVECGNYVEQPTILTTFGNQFPSLDFSNVGTTIWDNVMNPDSDYNKRMKAMYEAMENQSKQAKKENKPYIPQIQMPFSSFYLPSQFTSSPYNSYDYSFNPFGFGSFGTNAANNSSNKKSKRTEKNTAKVKSEKTEEAKKSDKTDEKETAKSVTNSNSKREFAEIYKSLGITDTRFQKIFEESILKSEGREYIWDVHAMAKCGIQQGTYNDYRARKGLQKRDVKNLTVEEMCDIYYNMFYIGGGASKIQDDRLALYVFDTDVNMGVGKGQEILKQSGNDADKFLEIRRKMYKSIAANNPKKHGGNLKGWLNRVDNVKRYADNNFSAVV